MKIPILLGIFGYIKAFAIGLQKIFLIFAASFRIINTKTTEKYKIYGTDFRYYQ